MSNSDELKGRAKEAVADLAGDDELKREGRIDRAEGAVKKTIDEAADKLKDVVHDRDQKADN